MGEFFNLDNKFFQVINKIVDCIGLSVLWILCSIPVGVTGYLAIETKTLIFWLISCITVVPAGVATTALYYAINKVIRHGRSYVWTEFWHSFRSNFKQAAVISVILSLVAVLLGVDAYIMYQLALSGQRSGAFYTIFIILLIFEAAWALYIFPYIARFENTTKQVLKNTAYIAVANLPRTVVMVVALGAVVLTVYLFPAILVVIPAAFMLLINLLMEKVFRKYMSEEDLAAEEERDRESYQ